MITPDSRERPTSPMMWLGEGWSMTTPNLLTKERIEEYNMTDFKQSLIALFISGLLTGSCYAVVQNNIALLFLFVGFFILFKCLLYQPEPRKSYVDVFKPAPEEKYASDWLLGVRWANENFGEYEDLQALSDHILSREELIRKEGIDLDPKVAAFFKGTKDYYNHRILTDVKK